MRYECLLILSLWAMDVSGAVHVRGLVTTDLDATGNGVVMASADNPVEVEMRAPSGFSRKLTTTTGEFEFVDVPAGTGYEIIAYDWSAFPYLRGTVSGICVNAEDIYVPIVVAFSKRKPDIYIPGEVELRGVLSRPDGSPAKRVAVILVLNDQKIGTARTDRHGGFNLPNVPVFEYLTVEVVESQSERSGGRSGLTDDRSLHSLWNHASTVSVPPGPPLPRSHS